MPAISVLLPVYNAAATLPAALASIASQTLGDYEIVAVDDGSTDASPLILRQAAQSEMRLRVLRIEHTGIVTALRVGLAACQAALVARMDADDLAYPTRLERQAAYLAEHPSVDVVGCLVRGFPDEAVREGFRVYLDWLNSLITDADIRRELFVESPLAHPSVVFRREVAERAGGYQERGWPEDYDLWMRLYLQGTHFGKVPEVLLDWREAPDRLTRTDGRYSVENFLRLKAHYLRRGPLASAGTVFVWGAGMMGRRLGKNLHRNGVQLEAYFDVDPRKVGTTCRGRPILPPEALPGRLAACAHPVVLAAVGARGARQIIRQRLNNFGLVEGVDWWGVA
jgi:glycosyltransferase involved in cell wall biosynthesis